jgi:hypothetical protein
VHFVPGKHLPAQAPGRFGEIVETDARHRPVPSKARGTHPQVAADQAGELGFQAHGGIFTAKSLKARVMDGQSNKYLA